VKTKTYTTWGIFLQSDGSLLDTAKSRLGAEAKKRKYSKGMPKGYCFVDKIIVP
jgi:hypothetical protein